VAAQWQLSVSSVAAQWQLSGSSAQLSSAQWQLSSAQWQLSSAQLSSVAAQWQLSSAQLSSAQLSSDCSARGRISNQVLILYKNVDQIKLAQDRVLCTQKRTFGMQANEGGRFVDCLCHHQFRLNFVHRSFLFKSLMYGFVYLRTLRHNTRSVVKLNISLLTVRPVPSPTVKFQAFLLPYLCVSLCGGKQRTFLSLRPSLSIPRSRILLNTPIKLHKFVWGQCHTG